jgi:hypothetical protein
MMKEQTLFTFGYLSSTSERIISELIALKIPLIDIRFRPVAKNHRYMPDAFRSRPGAIYIYIHELGNENYKAALNGKFEETDILIPHMDVGLSCLNDVFDEHGKAAIFCACSSRKTCHRAVVAQAAHERYGVKVVHLPLPRRSH